MKTTLIMIAVLIVIGGGYYWYSQRDAVYIQENSGENSPQTQNKLNIDAVCEYALSYMSFPDGESAARFVAECKAGEHPEVIERYRSEMNLGDGVAI